MENTNSKVFNKVTILVFLIGIVVGFGSASLWLRRSNNVGTAGEAASAVAEDMSAEDSDESAEKFADLSLAEISAALSGGKNSVSVANQSAGDAVAVSSVILEKDAWVAVHEDINGQPGKILGAQMFQAGTHSGAVDLLRGTAAGRTYYAMIHADDGDRAFDGIKDVPIKDADGNHIMTKFSATGETPAGNQ